MCKSTGRISFYLIILLLLVFFPSFTVRASRDTKVLILCSYSNFDSWESSIVDGFMSKVSNYVDVKVEFLDSRYSTFDNSDRYLVDYLTSKYSEDKIDYVVTLDDEAFAFVRHYLFDSTTFLYKKNIVFAGVNSDIELNNEEKVFVKGFEDSKGIVQLINLILHINKAIDTIYLYVNTNAYGYSLVDECSLNSDLFVRPVDLRVIYGNYFDDIRNSFNSINSSKSAICLTGLYKYTKEEQSEEIPAKEVLLDIIELTDAPIFSTLISYIDSGAIGGIVNNGYKIGMALAYYINSIKDGGYSLSVAPNDTFNSSYFNFKQIRRFNINPLLLPKDTVYINKKPYNLLLPRNLVILIWVIFLLFIIGSLYSIQGFIATKRIAKKKNLLLLESLEREKIRSDFIVTISHELRTPLNIIKNGANILKLKVKSDTFNEDYYLDKLDSIIRNSNRLHKYINNLIDISKFEMNEVVLNLSCQNIVSVVEDTVGNIIDLAQSRGLTVVFDTEEEEILMDTDVEKIQRVLLNILSNAIKFSKEIGYINIFIYKKDGFVVITIEDNGVGMSEDLVEHVFEKFKRADNQNGFIREQEGSGLGLTIVKNLVNLMGGDISITSALGLGTTVIVRLPIKLTGNYKKYSIESNSIADLELSDID